MPYKYNPFIDELDHSPNSGTTVVSEINYSGVPNVGTSEEFSRVDHTHGSSPEPFPVNGTYMNITGVDPAIELGYGIWTLMGQGEMFTLT